MVAYTLGSTLLPVCYVIDLAAHKPGREPPVPPWLTQTSDFIWMGCVACITSLTPPDLPLRATYEVVLDVDEVEKQPSLGPQGSAA